MVNNGSLALFQVDNNPRMEGVVPQDVCLLGEYNESVELGLSFDCGNRLCGCEWCPCPGPFPEEEATPNESSMISVNSKSNNNIFLQILTNPKRKYAGFF